MFHCSYRLLCKVSETFRENCSHFILKWFQPFPFFVLLRGELKNMQKIQILKIWEYALFSIREYAFKKLVQVSKRLFYWLCIWMHCSGVATGGHGGQSATPDSEKIAKNWEKNQEKLGKKRKNWEEKAKIRKKRQKSGRFFHFAPPDR